MTNIPLQQFECQLYVPAHGPMMARLAPETGPTLVARLVPLPYDELTDPGFRRLLAAFESIPSPLRAVQVS